MYGAFLQAGILKEPMQLLSQSICCRSGLCIHLGRTDLLFLVHLLEGFIIKLHHRIVMYKKQKKFLGGGWGPKKEVAMIIEN